MWWNTNKQEKGIQTAKIKADAEFFEYKAKLEEAERGVEELKQQVEAQASTILTLEATIRKYQTKQTREEIRKMSKEEIEQAIDKANKDLLSFKQIASDYRYERSPYRVEELRVRETPSVLKAAIQDTEDYIENLTREKYRKILAEEEMEEN